MNQNLVCWNTYLIYYTYYLFTIHGQDDNAIFLTKLYKLKKKKQPVGLRIIHKNTYKRSIKLKVVFLILNYAFTYLL